MDNETPEMRVRQLRNEIRARRLEQGLSQTKLALMINSGQSYIYRVESGRVKVGIDKLIKIADALDIPVRDLIAF